MNQSSSLFHYITFLGLFQVIFSIHKLYLDN
nr:MAG TPA: hypothetical protein [Caudoviricetes sp.]